VGCEGLTVYPSNPVIPMDGADEQACLASVIPAIMVDPN
jgi:hypothetical protein